MMGIIIIALVMGCFVLGALFSAVYELGKINKSIDQFKRKFGVK